MKGICKKVFCLFLMVCMCLSSFSLVNAASSTHYLLYSRTEGLTNNVYKTKKIYINTTTGLMISGMKVKSFKQSNKNIAVRKSSKGVQVKGKRKGSTVVTFKMSNGKSLKITFVVNGYKKINKNCITFSNWSKKFTKDGSVYYVPKSNYPTYITAMFNVTNLNKSKRLYECTCWASTKANRNYKVYLDGKLVKSENFVSDFEYSYFVKVPTNKGKHKITLKTGNISKSMYVVVR